ncbi:MAG: hypothetical protein GX653_01495 [Clostridiales bacterium]|nr:hypothetical protein [Clostridiales bacterium]
MTGDLLFFIIVNRGKAGQLLHKAQEIGASGGTIFLGEGTMPSRLFDILGINQTQKEVLITAVPDGVSDRLYAMLRDEFQLHKRYKGVAFAVPYRQWVPDAQPNAAASFTHQDIPPYLCLLTVLEKGKAEECMAVARAAGARGGTVIHGRGAGVPQDFYFPLVIEPQKEIVLIVASREAAYPIRNAIYAQMGLDQPGGGIIFSLPVLSTLGLYEERGKEVKA